MLINILAIGDVTGQSGIDILTERLPGVKKHYNIAFTVLNGENASNLGIGARQAEYLLDLADIITLGNHTWGRRDIIPFLDDEPNILRPANFAPQTPGRGWGIYETDAGNICVMNLIGRCGMYFGNENPFFEADKILSRADAKIVLVDFHAEATSEKYAMAYHLDGRASALWGTHTHVQTSDARVFPGGTGYITDLGMTGPCDSVIGVNPQQSLSRFLGSPPTRYEAAEGPAKIEGAVFEIDAGTGKCVSVEAIRVI